MTPLLVAVAVIVVLVAGFAVTFACVAAWVSLRRRWRRRRRRQRRAMEGEVSSVFKLLLNGTRVGVASEGNEGTSTSVNSDQGRVAPASALIEMDAATGMLR